MKKILLTSGSSFSFDLVADEHEKDHGKIDKWPIVLSRKLGFDLINKSKPNASNLYIYDHLMENIIKYDQDIGLVVAAWSYGFKTSLFRNYELNFISVDDQDWGDKDLVSPAEKFRDKIISSGMLVSSIEQTLRLMIYLQDTCDNKKIKCVHYPLLNIFKSYPDKDLHSKTLEQIINTESFQRVQSFNNIIGWPCDTFLGGYTFNTAHPEHVISKTNHHPSQEGQKIIASEIYDKYLKL